MKANMTRVLVRCRETGEFARVRVDEIRLSPSGATWVDGRLVEIIPEDVPATMDIRTHGFTDLEEALAIVQTAADLNPELIRYQPREVFDRAIVGIVRNPPDHHEGIRPDEWVLVYDYELAVRALSQFEALELVEAVEKIGEIVPQWFGQGTPSWRVSNLN